MTSQKASSTHVMPQPLGIYAAELFKRATEYLEAAERLLGSQGPELSYPLFYLITHAMELSLKAYLAARGISKRDLRDRKIGHDLLVLLSRCQELNMPTVSDLPLYVASLQEMGRDQDFRYPTSYILRPPPPRECMDIIRALLAAIKSVVATANVEATINFASETRPLGIRVRWSD